MHRLLATRYLWLGTVLALSGCFSFDNPREEGLSTIVARLTTSDPHDGSLSPVDGARCILEGTNKQATSSADGMVQFTGLEAGMYVVICIKDDRTFLVAIEVEAGETKELGTVELTSGGAGSKACEVDNGGCDPAATCSIESDQVVCSCNPNQTICGATCCDNASQNCVNGVCLSAGTCPENSLPCAAECCDIETEYCRIGGCISKECIPEEDLALCTRLGKNCGQVTAFDNCGITRTVASCGSCNESCTDNICSCTPQSDAEFCAAAGFSCNLLSGPDNCGLPRNGVNCGICEASLACNSIGLGNFCQPAFWQVASPAKEFLNSVWGSAPDNIWAFGNAGGIFHYDGKVWSPASRPTTNPITAAWGSAPDDVWAVSMGTAYHWNGASWTEVEAHPSNMVVSLLGVWGSSADDVWAVGFGTILHWQGASWTEVAAPPGTNNLWGVWGSASDDVWAVGDNALLHWQGSSWSLELSPYRLRGLWGSSANDVWAVGEGGPENGGVIMHFDGQSWTEAELPHFSHRFNAIWGSGPNDIWAIGDGGAALHWDGNHWVDVWSPDLPTDSSVGLASIWGTSASNVWTVGGLATKGMVLHLMR